MRKTLVIRMKGRMKMKSRSVVQIEVNRKDGKNIIKEFSVRDLDTVLIIGRGIFIESAVLTVLSSMNIPLSIISADSVALLMNPIITITNRYRQLQVLLDRKTALTIAQKYIEAKITGMVNILKYHRHPPPRIPEPPTPSDNEEEYESQIRNWEATSSALLWSHLLKLIKSELLTELRSKYGFRGRKPRHPDPFNKTLSVMYAVLYSLATKALIAAGLDPTYGFLHRTRYSTPLTFDYTEMFKPIAIEATITLINREGLPEIDDDGELTKEAINNAIKQLYDYLTLRHKDTGKTPYQQLHLKAFCLAKYLEGRCRQDRLTVTWDRALYRKRTHPKK